MGITIKVNRSAGPKKLLPCPLVPLSNHHRNAHHASKLSCIRLVSRI